MITPRRIITSWVCPPDHGAFRERDRKLFYRCLESWHRLMPDYDIRIVSMANLFDYGRDPWTEDRLVVGDMINVSHWARLYWLFVLGGVYVDMDVEAVKRFDGLLDGTFFAGHDGRDGWVNGGVMGAPAGHPFLLDQLRQLRETPTFDGNECGPRLLTRMLRQRGWPGDNGRWTNGSLTVYPGKAFYPYFWNQVYTPECITPDTIMVHHWASSWDQHA